MNRKKITTIKNKMAKDLRYHVEAQWFDILGKLYIVKDSYSVGVHMCLCSSLTAAEQIKDALNVMDQSK